MALPLSLINIPLAGLQTRIDPKAAPVGTMTLAENVWARRRTAAGGFEMLKRYGFSPISNAILGGGTISGARQVAVLNDELVLLDGLRVYTYSAVLQKWLLRGKAQQIAADIRRISGDEGPSKVHVDASIIGGYACVVASPDDGTALSTIARIYVVDLTTGETIFTETFGSGVYRAKVVANGTRFFIFSWSGSSGSTLAVRTIDTTTTITTVGPTTVSSSLGNLGLYDVGLVSGGVVAAYLSTTPGLSMHTVSNAGTPTIGSAVTYNAINPNESIGFISYDNANGSGYLGVGLDTGSGSRYQARLLTFNATTLANTADTTLESHATNRVWQITGYRSTVLNVFWTSRQLAGEGYNHVIRGYSNGSLFDVMLGVGLGSRVFKVGSKWHMVAAYQSSISPSTQKTTVDRQRTLLLELDEDGTSGVSIAGNLMVSDSAGLPVSNGCLPSVPTVSSGKVFVPAVGIQHMKADVATASSQTHSVVQITLDWSGAGLGRPVVYNGALYIPGACPKVYDGHFVTEAGILVSPEKPTGLAGTTGGGMTPSKTYQYCVVIERTDKTGRLMQSAPGPIATFTTGASDTKVTGSIPCYRQTETDPFYNVSNNVTDAVLALYRTTADLPTFQRCATVANNPRSHSVNFTDALADDSLEGNDILYTTSGELDNMTPPAVKVFHKHDDRLWAITGDQSTWHSKSLAEGFAAAFSDDLRFRLEEGEGAPLAMATVDSTLALFKRNQTFLLSGTGPDEKGNNPYRTPAKLNTDAGAVSAGAVMETDAGILAKSPKGWQFLGRDLALQQIDVLGEYDALSPAFGAAVDGRPLAVIPTNGAAIVFNWLHQQFYTWTGASSFLAGVSSARWRGNLVIAKSDGTVLQEVVGQYFDGTNTAIAKAVEVAWLKLANAKVYKSLLTVEAAASTTVTTTLTRNLDSAQTSTRSHSVTTATKEPLVHAPTTGDCAHVKLRIEESSATEGVRLTELDLEVGLRPGFQKQRAAAYGT